MAKIDVKLEIVISPAQPVQEVLSVLSAVCVYHPGGEDKILRGVQEAISKRLIEIEPSAE